MSESFHIKFDSLFNNGLCFCEMRLWSLKETKEEEKKTLIPSGWVFYDETKYPADIWKIEYEHIKDKHSEDLALALLTGEVNKV